MLLLVSLALSLGLILVIASYIASHVVIVSHIDTTHVYEAHFLDNYYMFMCHMNDMIGCQGIHLAHTNSHSETSKLYNIVF